MLYLEYFRELYLNVTPALERIVYMQAITILSVYGRYQCNAYEARTEFGPGRVIAQIELNIVEASPSTRGFIEQPRPPVRCIVAKFLGLLTAASCVKVLGEVLNMGLGPGHGIESARGARLRP